MALNLAPFSRWTLRDKAAQGRLALSYVYMGNTHPLIVAGIDVGGKKGFHAVAQFDNI